MAIQIDDNTDMNYTVPLLITDGNLIGYNAEADNANLIFYQTRKQTGDHIDKIDVVAAIYIPSLKALEEYRDAITSVIDQQKNREV